MVAKALCSVCLRGLSATATGLIRSHGPVGDRCPGSRKPPKQPDVSPRPTSPSSGRGPSSGQPPAPSPDVRSAASMDLAASLKPFPAARTLGRIPEAARYQCHAKLTTIMRGLAHRVSSKIEAGDFKGAIQRMCWQTVMKKRAQLSRQSILLPTPTHTFPRPLQHPISSSCQPRSLWPAAVVMAAIRSFPNGSTGGPDKLKPQYLKDLVQDVKPGEVSPFLCALTSFCTLVPRGDVPAEVRPLFFGSSLVALRKKAGGVRPIAVGCTLHHFVAKVASRMVRDEMVPLLSPKQLGYGVKGGAEAAVHATRSFLSSLAVGCAVVKLDFQIAFISIHRDKMLEATCDLVPEIFPFVHSSYSYSSPSYLLLDDRLILSAEGVQQGDPLGPLLVCLTLHQYCQRLYEDLCISPSTCPSERS